MSISTYLHEKRPDVFLIGQKWFLFVASVVVDAQMLLTEVVLS